MFIFSTICLVIVIGIIYFVSKYDQRKQTPPDIDFIIDDLHTTDEILPDDHFQDTLEPKSRLNHLDEMVRLSEEMGLYDEPKEEKSFYDMTGTFSWYKETNGKEYYYVKGYPVTKEGYQWARWVYGINQPYPNPSWQPNSNVGTGTGKIIIYYK